MGSSVTFHDKVGHDRLAAAVEPTGADAALAIMFEAVTETIETAIGTRPAEVELTLCGDAEMTRLNFDHMGEREPTDVLSFPLHEWTVEGGHSHFADDDGGGFGPLVLGDVVIDLDQAVRQTADGDWTVTEELVLLAVHGTLHLLGHDHDETDGEAAMRDIEHQVMNVVHRKHRGVGWKPGSLFDRSGHAVGFGA